LKTKIQWIKKFFDKKVLNFVFEKSENGQSVVVVLFGQFSSSTIWPGAGVIKPFTAVKDLGTKTLGLIG